MIVYALFATVSWFIIERAGRRQLYLWGTVGQGLSMVIVFACLIPGTASAAKGAAVGLFTYIASFGATWLPLPWVSTFTVSNSQIANAWWQALPGRDQPHQNSSESQCTLNMLQLAFQLL